MFNLIAKGQFKTLFSALIAPLIVFVGNVFKFSQRKSFDYGKALTNTIQHENHPLVNSRLDTDAVPMTLSQLFTVYDIDQNTGKTFLETPFVFPSGDGNYRIRFRDLTSKDLTSKDLTSKGIASKGIATTVGPLTDGDFINVTVLDGVPVDGEIEGFSIGQNSEINGRVEKARVDAIVVAAAGPRRATPGDGACCRDRRRDTAYRQGVSNWQLRGIAR